MKKLMFLMFVGLAFASCTTNPEKVDTPANPNDSAAVDTVVVNTLDTITIDTAAVAEETTAE